MTAPQSASIPEQLNREQVVRIVLERPREIGLDNFTLAAEIVTALDRWDALPPEDVEGRRDFLSTLHGDQDE